MRAIETKSINNVKEKSENVMNELTTELFIVDCFVMANNARQNVGENNRKSVGYVAGEP